MDVATRYVRVSGAKTEVNGELPVGTYDVTLVVKGDIVKEEIGDNQNGSVDVTYVLKAHEVMIKK